MERPEEKTRKRWLLQEKLYTDGIIVDDSGSLDDSLMWREYRQAGRLIGRIIHESEAAEKRTRAGGPKINNTISLVGTRGTGKTSVMLSIQNFLERDNLKDNVRSLFASGDTQDVPDHVSFVNLPYIDASVLKSSEDVMSIILARMLRYLCQMIEPAYQHGSDPFEQEETRSLFRQFESVHQAIMTLNDRHPLQEGESALRRLQSLVSSFTLADSFRELVDSFLHFAVRHRDCSVGQRAFLVIALDDVDRYMPDHQDGMQEKNAYTLLGQIDDYLKIPGIIVLMTYDEELLKHNCRCHMAEKFQLGADSEMAAAQAEQYLTKIAPNRQRIYMPNLGWEDRPDATRLRIVLDRERPLLPACQSETLPAKELVFYYLAENYGCFFDAKGKKRHFFEELNLRRLTDLVLALSLNPQEKEEDGGYSRLMGYIYNPFKNFFLTGEEVHLFDSWLEKPIDRRSRDIVDYIRSRYSNNRRPESQVNDWGYSYGELLFHLYQATREKGEDRTQPILSKGMVKCILASYSIVLSHLVREENEENHALVKRVLGTSLGGHWSNEILPTLFISRQESADREQQQDTDQVHVQLSLNSVYRNRNKGMNPPVQTLAGALNIKGSLKSVFRIAVGKPRAERVPAQAFIPAVELLGMFFTSIQSEGKPQSFALTYDPDRDILSTEADSACFNILNFVVNAYDWEAYFDGLHSSLKNVLGKYYSDGDQALWRMAGSELPQKDVEALLKRYSMRVKYKRWAQTGGACALPFQHFDMMYNIMKRQRDDRPHGLKAEAGPGDFLNCCRTVYENFRAALREQDQFFEKGLAQGRANFEDAFWKCPFIERIRKKDDPATQLLEGWMAQVVGNMASREAIVGHVLEN